MPVEVTITDPDGDDLAAGEWKTRPNTNGSRRGRFEVEVSPLEVGTGKQYRLSVTVVEVVGGADLPPPVTKETPNLTPK
ncbi:MAG: hypothetical protein L0216_02295 [Planctomycetales bacterium]|nr:hypothetical protein [Planctomycetales bacterium]